MTQKIEKSWRNASVLGPFFRVLLLVFLLSTFYFLLFSGIAFAQTFQGPSTSTPGAGSGAIGINAAHNVSIGTSTPLNDTKFLIVASTSDSSAYVLKVESAASGLLLIVRNDGTLAIGTTTFSGGTVNIGGNITVGGTVIVNNSLSGTVTANNVTPGAFNNGTGGVYAFPSSVGVATTTNGSLPQALSVFGGGYFSGKVGIGTTTPQSNLVVQENSAAGTGATSMYNDLANGITNYVYGSSYSGGSVFNVGANGGAIFSKGGTFAVGAYDANAFILGTSNSARITILSGGNVGIGTSQPSSTLHVYGGDLTVSGAGAGIGVGTTTTVNGGAILANNVSTTILAVTGLTSQTCLGTNSAGALQAGTCGGSGTVTTSTAVSAGYFPYWANTTGGLNGTSSIFQSGGNVGVGTANPGQKLEVAGNISSTQVCLGGTCNSTWPSALSGGQANYIPIWTSATAQSTSTIYQSGGNVGIATTSPAYALDVVGTIRASGSLIGNYAGNITANNVTPGAFNSGTGGVYAFPSNVGVATTTNGSLPQALSVFGGGYFSNNVGVGVVSPSYALDVSGGLRTTATTTFSGNVGIGTAGPSYPLDVNGEPRFAGYRTWLTHSTPQLRFGNPAAGGGNGVWEVGMSGAANDDFFFTNASSSKSFITLSEQNSDIVLYQNVGIGVTVPGQRLEVAGNVSSSGLCLGGACNSTWPSSGTGTVTTSTAVSAGYVPFWNSTNGSGLNGTSTIYISGGKVGIGTTSPAYALDVRYDTGGATARFSNLNSSVGPQVNISNNAGNGISNVVYGSAYSGGSVFSVGANGSAINSTGGTFGVGTYDTNSLILATNNAARITILSGGNVGIGKTNPGFPLDVNGTAQFGANGWLQLVDTGGGNGRLIASSTGSLDFGALLFRNKAGTTQFAQFTSGGAFLLGTTTAPANVLLYAADATPSLFLNTSGQVGIGTTNPSTKLEVNGTVSSTAVTVGPGKITAGTWDPIYTIGGVNYATYGSGMTGQKEETSGAISNWKLVNGNLKATLDFGNAEKGSDLWLFYQATDFGKAMDNLVVQLTPSFDGRVWYKKDALADTLTIFASTSDYQLPLTNYEVSYRLTANRFDSAQWPNVSEDQTSKGLQPPEK